MKIRLLLLLSISLCAAASQAEVYKYVDEDGRVHYLDKKSMRGDAAEKAEKVELNIKPLTAEEKKAAAEKTRRIEAQQQLRREQAGAAKSNSHSANKEYYRRNCRYYRDKLATAKQRKKDLKLSGYTIGQKESADARISDMQARVRQYCH